MAASARGTALPKEITKAQENATRIQLGRTEGEEVFLDELHKTFSRNSYVLFQELQAKKSEIDKLRKKNVIREDQYELLLPSKGNTVDSDEFDITLLMVFETILHILMYLLLVVSIVYQDI